MEKRLLQIAVTVCSIVPIAAGGAGVLMGPAMMALGGANPERDLDSHFRYLSGLLLGIGLAYLSGVPGIERKRIRFLLLGGIVVAGGLGRLYGLMTVGVPSNAMIFALAMELAITPALTFWQYRVSATA